MCGPHHHGNSVRDYSDETGFLRSFDCEKWVEKDERGFFRPDEPGQGHWKVET